MLPTGYEVNNPINARIGLIRRIAPAYVFYNAMTGAFGNNVFPCDVISL